MLQSVGSHPQIIRVLGSESPTPLVRAGAGNLTLIGAAGGAITLWVMAQTLNVPPIISLLFVGAFVFLLLRMYSRLVLRVCIDEVSITIVCPLQNWRIPLDNIAVMQIRRPRWWLRRMKIVVFRTSVRNGEEFLVQSVYGDELRLFQQLVQMFESRGLRTRAT